MFFSKMIEKWAMFWKLFESLGRMNEPMQFGGHFSTIKLDPSVAVDAKARMKTSAYRRQRKSRQARNDASKMERVDQSVISRCSEELGSPEGATGRIHVHILRDPGRACHIIDHRGSASQFS